MTTVHTPSRRCYQLGCRTEGCIRESYLYEKQLDLDHNRGHRRNHDATQTRIHIERLIAAGWIHRQIAEAANSTRPVISALVKGQPEVRSTTALAILSIPIGPPPVPVLGVDATGTMRRIQALVYIGHSCQTIASRTDFSDDKIGRIAAGWFTTVSADTAATVARAYRHLLTMPGASPQARNHARSKQWHGPLDWDDIDDPQCQPETGRRRQDGPGRREKVDDTQVARLTAEGLSAEQIARELRCHKRTVVRARGRAQTEMAVAA